MTTSDEDTGLRCSYTPVMTLTSEVVTGSGGVLSSGGPEGGAPALLESVVVTTATR